MNKNTLPMSVVISLWCSTTAFTGKENCRTTAWHFIVFTNAPAWLLLENAFHWRPCYNDLDFGDIVTLCQESPLFLRSDFSTRAPRWFSCSFAERTCVQVETIFPLGVSYSVWTPLLALLHQRCAARSELRRVESRPVEQTSRGTQQPSTLNSTTPTNSSPSTVLRAMLC